MIMNFNLDVLNYELADLFDFCSGETSCIYSQSKRVPAEALVTAVVAKYAPGSQELRAELLDRLDPTDSNTHYSKEEFIRLFKNWMSTATSPVAAEFNHSFNSESETSSFIESAWSSTPLSSNKNKQPSFSALRRCKPFEPGSPISPTKKLNDDCEYSSSPNRVLKNTSNSPNSSFLRSLKQSNYDLRSKLSITEEIANSLESRYESVLNKCIYQEEELKRFRELFKEKSKIIEEESDETTNCSGDSSRTVSALKFELNNAIASADKYRSECIELMKAVDTLEEELSEVKITLRNALDAKKCLTEKVEEMEKEKLSSAEELVNMKSQINQYLASLKTVKLEKARMAEEIGVMSTEMGKLKSEVNYLMANSIEKEDTRMPLSLFEEISELDLVHNEETEYKMLKNELFAMSPQPVNRSRQINNFGFHNSLFGRSISLLAPVCCVIFVLFTLKDFLYETKSCV